MIIYLPSIPKRQTHFTPQKLGQVSHREMDSVKDTQMWNGSTKIAIEFHIPSGKQT